MNIRTVIVDDSDMDRFNLRILLKRCPEISVIAECATASLAVETINREKPDLVFLDIQMPGGSGFDVLEKLLHAPHIIFVTAFDHYAVRAFEVNAVDYLLKPILLERLKMALARVPAALGQEEEMRPAGRPLAQDEQLFVKSGGRQFFIPVSRISAICAAGDYSQVLLPGQPPLEVRRRMTEWAKFLPEDLFLQVDRSLIVNRTQIRGIERLSRTSARLSLANLEKPLPIGRAGLESLQKALPSL